MTDCKNLAISIPKRVKEVIRKKDKILIYMETSEKCAIGGTASEKEK